MCRFSYRKFSVVFRTQLSYFISYQLSDFPLIKSDLEYPNLRWKRSSPDTNLPEKLQSYCLFVALIIMSSYVGFFVINSHYYMPFTLTFN